MANDKPGRPVDKGPCTAQKHNPTPHGYRRGCRCPEARAAWTAYQSDYQARRRTGEARPRTFNPETQLIRQREKQLREEAEKMRKFKLAQDIADRNHALAVCAQRRLRALMRIGYTQANLTTLTGLGATTIISITGNKPGSIRPATAELVKAVYDTCQFIQGPSKIAAMYAHGRGYLPPAAWDPHDLDDPDAEPTWPRRKPAAQQLRSCPS